MAPGAVVMGKVTLGRDSSVFYNCTLRADINHITIGARSNIQVRDGYCLAVYLGASELRVCVLPWG